MKQGISTLTVFLSLAFFSAHALSQAQPTSPARAPRSTKELKPARVKRKLSPKKVKPTEQAVPTTEKSTR